MKHRHYPRYNDDADFTTNAPSYYEDLARKEKLIRLLAERIWGYEQILDDTLEEIQERFRAWDKNLEDFPDDVKVLLQQWLDDGTLDHIINDTIFNWKLDTSIFEQFRDTITAQLQQTEQELNAQLADIAINVKSFGVKGDGVTDDTQAIQKLLDNPEKGLNLFFPEGTYLVQTLYVKRDYTKILGNKATIKYSGSVGGDLLVIDKVLHNGNSSWTGIEIEGIRFDGSDKTRYLIYADGLSSNCILFNIELMYSVGFLYSSDCWYSKYDTIRCWNQTKEKPTGMTEAIWDDVCDNLYKGAFALHEANSCHISNIHFGRMGSVDTSRSKKMRQLFYLLGMTITIEVLSFENTHDYDLNKTVLQSLMFIPGPSNAVNIRSLYLENVAMERLAQMSGGTFQGIRFNGGYMYNCRITTNAHIFYTRVDGDVQVNDFLSLQMESLPNTQVISADTSSIGGISGSAFYTGELQNISGKNYSVMTYPQQGMTGMSTAHVSDGSTLPMVRTGLTAEVYGSNGIKLEPGTIVSSNGETVHIGGTHHRPELSKVGWVFYPTVEGSYNLCIDIYGNAFVENTLSPRLSTFQGKIILYTFSISTTGAVTNLIKLNNAYYGTYTNRANNKIVYLTSPPLSGTHKQGDRCVNTTPIVGQPASWVCTESGTPGIWVVENTL